MTKMKQICKCDKCGNEADMIITCTWVDVEEKPGVIVKKKKETRKCSVCGSEADMILEGD